MRHLAKNLRRRAAIAIAVAYAFCVLAPAGALAVIASPTVFHCIDDLNVQAMPAKHESAAHGHDAAHSHTAAQNAAHKHDDSGAHSHDQVSTSHAESGAADHHSGTGGKSHSGNCCGLFCVSAIAHDPGLTFGVSAPASSSVAPIAEDLAGRAPSPLHRPPIA